MSKPVDPQLKKRNSQRRAYMTWWAKKPPWPSGEGYLDRPRRPLDVRDGNKIAELQAEIDRYTDLLLLINLGLYKKGRRNTGAVKELRELMRARLGVDQELQVLSRF